METVFFPKSNSFRACIRFFFASSLSCGATASSKSMQITSALLFTALGNKSGLDPGIKSSDLFSLVFFSGKYFNPAS